MFFFYVATAIKYWVIPKKIPSLSTQKFFDSKFPTNGLWASLLTKINFKASISFKHKPRKISYNENAANDFQNSKVIPTTKTVLRVNAESEIL